jgi:hypothetical protein
LTASKEGRAVLDLAFAIQLAGSALAVAMLVGLAAWLGRPNPTPALDEAAARERLAIEFPGAPIQGLWIAADGRSALARSGELALALFQVGDGYVARSLAWEAARALKPVDGRLTLKFPEAAAPRARLAFAAWPPAEA